jgi:hypothetical protein
MAHVLCKRTGILAELVEERDYPPPSVWTVAERIVQSGKRNPARPQIPYER